MNEQKRAVIEKKLATESMPASAELNFISPAAPGIDGQVHSKDGITPSRPLRLLHGG
ncbi:MAG: hypothetical protein ABSB35_14130 [Bryobacteraceae bacterium]